MQKIKAHFIVENAWSKKIVSVFFSLDFRFFFSRGPLLYKTLAQATKSMKYFR